MFLKVGSLALGDLLIDSPPANALFLSGELEGLFERRIVDSRKPLVFDLGKDLLNVSARQLLLVEKLGFFG